MDANELRALADALDDCYPPYYESSPTINRSLDACIAKAADYLRAQADAHPAPDVPAGWKLVPVEPTGLMVDAGREAMQRAPDLGGIVSANTAEVMDSYTAMLAAAPAVPQAEPKREDQPLRDLLAIIHCDGGHHTEAVGIEQSIKDALSAGCVLKGKLAQTEPKREPLTYEQLVSACYTYSHNFGLLDPDEQEIVIEEAGRWAKALGIGGSDE